MTASVAAARPALLAPEDLAQTLQTIQTLLALYADPDADDADDDGQGDVDLDATNEAAIKSVAKFMTLPLASLGDAHSTTLRDSMPERVAFGLRLRPWRGASNDDDDDDNASSKARRALWLDVKLPLRRSTQSDGDGDLVRWPAWNVRTASWLKADQHAKLVSAAQKAAQTFRQEHHSAENEDGLAASYVLHVAEVLCEEAVGF